MIEKPMTESDFISKIDWEGGIIGALEYGLTADDVEPGSMRDAWRKLDELWAPMEDAIADVQAIIDEAADE